MTVFVGRARELDHLTQRFEQALEGRGGVVFITGEAGAGKSSLCRRFLVEAALRVPEARVIAGDCSEQYGAGEPYQPFVEALHDLLTADGRAGGRLSFREMARELAPHWLAAIPVAGDIVAATVATAMELRESFGGTTATAAPPSEEALFFQYTELLLAAAARQPLVLFLDDLHWADHASVSLLMHVARKVADKPVLILGTYRAADVEVAEHPIKRAKLELERYGVAEELALASLESADFAALIAEELGGPPTRELLEWLERRAGSNPLFFSELLRWLVDSGIAGERYGEWALARVPEEFDIPRSAASAIEKRLTRLDPELYRILEYASVEGDEFDSTVLARMLEMDELELEEKIEPLVSAHRLIRHSEMRDLPGGEITDVYVFAHTLFQDVLHRNVRGKRKVLLHRKVAQILEEIFGADKELIVHKLAIHYDEGRLPDRAYEFSLRAAERASRVYAHWDALGLLQRALRNCGSEDNRVEVVDRLGEENRLIGRFSDALERFDEALEISESLGDRHRRLALKRKKFLVERDHGHLSAADLLDQLRDLTEEARELGAREELCQILWTRSHPLHETCGGDRESVDAADLAREALSIAEQLGKPDLAARAHYELGTALAFGGHPAEGITHLGESLGFYQQAGDKDRIGRCRNCMAVAHAMQGKYRAAAQEFQEAATAFDEIGHPASEASVRNNLGVLLSRIGDWAGAEENLREAARLFQLTDATVQLLHPLQNLAELRQAMGDLDAARDQWEKLLERARETGYWKAEIIALCGLGVVRLERGDLDGARQQMEAARKLMREEEGWSESQEACQLFAARLSAAEGDIERSLQLLESAAEALAERDRYLWAKVRLMEGEISSARDAKGALLPVRQALAAFEELGAEPMRERAADLLARLEGRS